MPRGIELPEHSELFDLLVDLTRAGDDPALETLGTRLEDCDWAKLADLATYHRVDGLVAATLLARENWPIPVQWRQHFQERRKDLTFKKVQNLSASASLSKLFAASGIRHILIKGAAISERYYGDTALRQAIDVDIWIAPEDLESAIETLDLGGFKRPVQAVDIPQKCVGTYRKMVNELSFGKPSPPISLDLHWRLNVNPYFLPWAFDEIYERTDRLRIANTDIPVLNQQDQLINIYTHGAKHAWFRLKWLADLYRTKRILPEDVISASISAAKSDGSDIMFETGDALFQQVYERQTPTSSLPPSMITYMHRMILTPISYDSLSFANFSKLASELKYKIKLRRELKYKVSTVVHYCLNINDIPVLRLSERFFPVYVILGPVLGVCRMIGRSLDGLRSRSQNEPNRAEH